MEKMLKQVQHDNDPWDLFEIPKRVRNDTSTLGPQLKVGWAH